MKSIPISNASHCFTLFAREVHAIFCLKWPYDVLQDQIPSPILAACRTTGLLVRKQATLREKQL